MTKIAKELLEVADCISSCRKYTDELLRENPNDQFGLKIKSCQQRMVVLLKKYDIE